VELDAKRAEPGQRPATEASATNIPVTITAVDARNNIVSFCGEDGLVRAPPAR
jgi:hypothetical protein